MVFGVCFLLFEIMSGKDGKLQELTRADAPKFKVGFVCV